MPVSNQCCRPDTSVTAFLAVSKCQTSLVLLSVTGMLAGTASCMSDSRFVCTSQVLDWELQRQLVPYMKEHVPLPGIYDADFIAANQDTRADNIIKGTRSEQVEQVRQQIRTFKEEQKLDKVQTTLLHLWIVCILALRWYSAQSGIRRTLQPRLSRIVLCIVLYTVCKPRDAHILVVCETLCSCYTFQFCFPELDFMGPPKCYRGCLCSQAAFVQVSCQGT